MSETKTTNLDITYLSKNQTDKEALVNDGFIKLDAMVGGSVISKTTATPPASPNDGDLYIIPAAATGDWADNKNNITIYNTSKGWIIIEPNEGLTSWVNDENIIYSFDGTAWINALNISNVDKLGINATADTTNKLAVKSDAVLFDNDGDDSQVKVNKDSATDNASHLFQTGYSGRAEFGLTGDDDFHIKVSADGSTWHEAAIIDKSSGEIHIQEGISFDDGTNLLSDYEEGTWTPRYNNNLDDATVTHNYQVGHYVKLGKKVDVWGRISTTSFTGTGNGKMRIFDLPFSVLNTSAMSFSGDVGYASGFTSSPASVIAVENSSIIELEKRDSSDATSGLATILRENDMNTGSGNDLQFHVSYLTN